MARAVHAIAVGLLLSGVASAQSVYEPLGPGVPVGPSIPGIPGSGGAGGLREVDPGIADVDPLRTSLLYTGGQADFRTPLGFDRVFVGADGRFYRISGSLVAAFDRSQYVADANGVYPEVPAGTIYYTGGLPPEAIGNGAALEPLPTATLRASGRASGRVAGALNASATVRAGSPSQSPSVGGVGGIAYESGSALALEREPPPAEPTMANDEA